MHKASCNCGAIRIDVDYALTNGNACHCTTCRKMSGHYWSSVEVPKDAVTIHGAEDINWYKSSEKVRRGFCGTCGSVLFFEPIFHDWTSISYGAFDQSTKTKIESHIYVDDKGDYYEIADGLPQNRQ